MRHVLQNTPLLRIRTITKKRLLHPIQDERNRFVLRS